MKALDLQLDDATTPAAVDVVRDLFREYERGLGIDLCFQNFEHELATLPGDYAPPGGRLVLARVTGEIAGCVALRRLDADACEVKRLYLRPQFRGGGRGRRLAQECIASARRLGYARMRLDTLPVMREAIALYRSLGFREIAPYRPNPVAGALYMELDLHAPDTADAP
jgi:ribosomal protein S18 acetylase RimI-like enzyme